MGGLLSYFENLFGPREMTILMLGLNNAGKSSIVYRQVVGEAGTAVPSVGLSVELVKYKNFKFRISDFGGSNRYRKWYIADFNPPELIDAIIYVVDSADPDSIEESKDDLRYMLEEVFKEVIFVVLANKQDLPNCLSVEEIHKGLGLNALRNRTFKVFKTSVLTGEGLDEVMDWLGDAISVQKKNDR